MTNFDNAEKLRMCGNFKVIGEEAAKDACNVQVNLTFNRLNPELNPIC